MLDVSNRAAGRRSTEARSRGSARRAVASQTVSGHRSDRDAPCASTRLRSADSWRWTGPRGRGDQVSRCRRDAGWDDLEAILHAGRCPSALDGLAHDGLSRLPEFLVGHLPVKLDGDRRASGGRHPHDRTERRLAKPRITLQALEDRRLQPLGPGTFSRCSCPRSAFPLEVRPKMCAVARPQFLRPLRSPARRRGDGRVMSEHA